MSCAAWRVIRRPEYREDLDASEAWIATDNPIAASEYVVYFDQDESNCTVIVRAVVHVARKLP